MRRVFLATMVVVLAVGLSGCVLRRVSNEPDRTESRDVSGFDSVSFAGYGELKVRQGSSYKLEVTGAGDVVDRVETEVRGDTLYIEWDSPGIVLWGGVSEPDLEIELTVPDLQRLEVSGAGEVTIDGLETEAFAFELSGAGAVFMDDLDVEELVVDLSGAGSAEVDGSAKSQEVSISGLGTYDARDLASDTARVEMSGAGTAIVWAEDSLDVELSGAGTVEYYGSPAVTQDISGVGSVEGRGSR